MPKRILDDVEGTRRIDKSNMLGFCTEAAKHYRESFENAKRIKLGYPTPENVVVAGMGGSAIGGELIKDYTRQTAEVPIEISREYQLPNYAGKNSLVILASYSGDTEETLSSLLDALKRGCMIFCVSSGGALLRFAERLRLPYLRVKGGMPPRASLPHMFVPLLKCVEDLGFATKAAEDFSEATNLLEDVSKSNAFEQPVGDNFAKTLALKLERSSPVVYGFGLYRGVALRFKQQFNENAKVPAKWESFSELNHNETMGWEKPGKLSKCYSIIFLRDKEEPVEIRSRIENAKELMKPTVPNVFEVWAQGKSNLAKMLSTILVGDFASIYLAYLRGVDPTPVDTIAVMKQRIEKNRVKAKVLQQLESMSKGG